MRHTRSKTRPNIGWMAYLIFAQSPRQLAVVLLAALFVTGYFVMDAQYTLTLEYQQPHQYPPPTIILGDASTSHLTGLDACGIEAATRAVESPSVEDVNGFSDHWKKEAEDVAEILKHMKNPMNIPFEEKESTIATSLKESHDHKNLKQQQPKSSKSKDRNNTKPVEQTKETLDDDPNGKSTFFKWSRNKTERRMVWVFLWSTTVFKGDKWTHFVAKLPGVRLARLDPTKVLEDTHVSSWQFTAGLSSQEDWVSYLTASMGLLWTTGGMVMQLGVILTRPLAVTSLGDGVGVLTAAPRLGSALSPMIIGTPPKHPVLEALLNNLVNSSSSLPPQTGWSPLLTDAVEDGCGSAYLPYLFISDCSDFTMIPGEEVLNQHQYQEGSTGTLLHYTGNASDMDDPARLRYMFRNLQLHELCPLVAKEVLRDTRDTGL